MSEFTNELLSYTGRDDFNAVYTITIGELMEAGVFDWAMPELDWSSAALNEAQYKRICDYFIERFYYREISLEPFAEWARMIKRKFIYETMPKYNPLYERLANGFSPLSNEDEYYKSRIINSKYPQTLLSENSDYLTSGRDEENERIKEGNFSDMMTKYAKECKAIDEMLLDEFEPMFICLYTTNYNATW